MESTKWFAVVLISFSISLGIVISVFIGPWAMLIGVAAAAVGSYAVERFCRADPHLSKFVK